MNRGRHRNSERSKIIRLARYHGALKAEKWHITMEQLNSIIEAQYNNCGFNDLHIFETKQWSTANRTIGGFRWDDTNHPWIYWNTLLEKIYTDTNYG